MAKNNNFAESEFYCTKCGKKGIPVLRRKGQEREAGHLKKLFCLNCQQECNHAECKPYSHYDYEDFKNEFENGNFNNEGLRILPYGAFKEKMRKGAIINDDK